MRVTKRQLRRIIKEEKARLLTEAATGGMPGDDGVLVVDRGNMDPNAKDRWLVRYEVEDIVPPELYTYLSKRSDWRKITSGPKATGPTEVKARAKLNKAIDKFLAMLAQKIIEAQNEVDMLDEFRASLEKL